VCYAAFGDFAWVLIFITIVADILRWVVAKTSRAGIIGFFLIIITINIIIINNRTCTKLRKE